MVPDVISLELLHGLGLLAGAGKSIRVVMTSPPSAGAGALGPLMIVRQRETDDEVELVVTRSIKGRYV